MRLPPARIKSSMMIALDPGTVAFFAKDILDASHGTGEVVDGNRRAFTDLCFPANHNGGNVEEMRRVAKAKGIPLVSIVAI